MNTRTLAAFALLLGTGLALDAPVAVAMLAAFAAGALFYEGATRG